LDYGPRRDDAAKRIRAMIPYGDLPDPKSSTTARPAMETVKAILAALGCYASNRKT